MTRKFSAHVRDHERSEFTDGWTWDRVVKSWQGVIAKYPIKLDPVVEEIEIYSPSKVSFWRGANFWLERHRVAPVRRAIQKHALLGHNICDLEPCDEKARNTTAGWLIQMQNELSGIVAVLLNASLVAHAGRHGDRDGSWPAPYRLRTLEQWIGDAVRRPGIQGSGPISLYHNSQSWTLPYLSYNDEYKLDTLAALVRYAAEEHAVNLLRFVPVTVRLIEIPDQLFVDDIRAEIEQERRGREQQEREAAERHKVWEAEWAAQRKQEAEHRVAMRAKHPRWGEWHTIEATELYELVWSMPTSDVARLFGISDVAVAKRCKALRISKPGRGFWRRVETGWQPHPGGQEAPTKRKLRKPLPPAKNEPIGFANNL